MEQARALAFDFWFRLQSFLLLFDNPWHVQGPTLTKTKNTHLSGLHLTTVLFLLLLSISWLVKSLATFWCSMSIFTHPHLPTPTAIPIFRYFVKSLHFFGFLFFFLYSSELAVKSWSRVTQSNLDNTHISKENENIVCPWTTLKSFWPNPGVFKSAHSVCVCVYVACSASLSPFLFICLLLIVVVVVTTMLMMLIVWVMMWSSMISGIHLAVFNQVYTQTEFWLLDKPSTTTINHFQ